MLSMPRELTLLVVSLAAPLVFVGIVAVLGAPDRPRGRGLLVVVAQRAIASLVGFAVGWLLLARWSMAVPGCAPGGDCAAQCFTIYGAQVPCSGWWDALAVVFGFVMTVVANWLWTRHQNRSQGRRTPNQSPVVN